MPRVTSLRVLPAVCVVALTACATGGRPHPFPAPSSPPSSEASPAPAGASAPTPQGPDVQPSPGPGTQPAAVPGAEAGARPLGPAVAELARSLVGAPYRNGGSDPSGFDCSGLVQYVFAQAGIAVPRQVLEQYDAGRAVDAKDLQAGDLVFFYMGSDSRPSHVGILIRPGVFLHAPSSRGIVRVEQLDLPYWRSRLAGARRIDPGFAATVR